MPQPGLIFRALIASPGDLVEERNIIPEVIATWNATHSLHLAAIIEPVKWESHSVPRQGERPQELINRQIGDHCDFLIGVFWTRLGSNTGKAASGTLEEIEEFQKAGKDVLLYFSNKPVVPGDLNSEQYKKLMAFKVDSKNTGLHFEYSDIATFKEHLSRHIHQTVVKHLAEHKQELNSSNYEQVSQPAAIWRELNTYINRAQLAWAAERARQPSKLDTAKSIIDEVAEKLLDFLSLHDDDLTETIKNNLTQIVGQAKQMQDHEVYLDGGVSYNNFWDAGDTLTSEAKATCAENSNSQKTSSGLTQALAESKNAETTELSQAKNDIILGALEALDENSIVLKEANGRLEVSLHGEAYSRNEPQRLLYLEALEQLRANKLVNHRAGPIHELTYLGMKEAEKLRASGESRQKP